MNRLEEISARRELLVKRAAVQRNVVGEMVEHIQRPFGLVNLGMALINYVKARPVISVGLTTAFLIAKPRRFISWGKKIWVIWQLYHSWKTTKTPI